MELGGNGNGQENENEGFRYGNGNDYQKSDARRMGGADGLRGNPLSDARRRLFHLYKRRGAVALQKREHLQLYEGERKPLSRCNTGVKNAPITMYFIGIKARTVTVLAFFIVL